MSLNIWILFFYTQLCDKIVLNESQTSAVKAPQTQGFCSGGSGLQSRSPSNLSPPLIKASPALSSESPADCRLEEEGGGGVWM